MSPNTLDKTARNCGRLGGSMELGMIGLGRMGGNMATRLVRGGHRVVAHSRTKARVDEARAGGAEAAYATADLVRALHPPRVIWLMVPAGDATDAVLEDLLPRLAPGDLIVDGGNSYYKDTVRRAARATSLGLRYVDVGTSGGVWGLEGGYSMMVGGAPEDVERLRPALET
ncbi:MAG: NAD(P)-binding domain-containing protein, partial [Thermoplasmata archaeon]